MLYTTIKQGRRGIAIPPTGVFPGVDDGVALSIATFATTLICVPLLIGMRKPNAATTPCVHSSKVPVRRDAGDQRPLLMIGKIPTCGADAKTP